MGGEEQQAISIEVQLCVSGELKNPKIVFCKRFSPHPPTPYSPEIRIELERVISASVRIFGERGSQGNCFERRFLNEHNKAVIAASPHSDQKILPRSSESAGGLRVTRI